MGIIGIVSIILVAYLLCNNKTQIKLRTVIPAFLLLIFLSIFISSTNIGILFIKYLATVVNMVIQQGQVGAKFIFGDFIKDNEFIFAINVLTNMIFLGALIALLYHLRIMQTINFALSYILYKLLKITKPEGLSAAINIFVGPGETTLILKPYFKSLNNSQLFFIMVCGFASVSGSIMGGYIALGISSEYIISAILLIIPSSILIAKIMYPDTSLDKDTNKLQLSNFVLKEKKTSNIIDAISQGTYDGLKVAVIVGAMLITFLSLLSLVNIIIEYIGQVIHIHSLSLQKIAGYIFAPLAYIMGVSSKDIMMAGLLIAEKTFTNEFVAFIELKKNMEFLDTKTQIIMTYALCGFSNLGTIGIFIGSIQGVFPEIVKNCSKFAFKALFAAILVNLLNGTIAGIIFDLQNILSYL